MPRFEVPLLGKAIRATGDVVLRAELELLIKNGDSDWIPLIFRLDTGSEMSTMSAHLASRLGLPIPQKPIRNLTVRGVANEVRAGLLRVRILAFDPAVFNVPCFFIGPLAPAADAMAHPSHAVNVLGLTGVVDQWRFLLDGMPAPHAIHGTLAVEALGI